ncbi:toxin-antitoxin system antitoxin subunit [Galactobacter sp.]|uniref:FitA-like ribbon-helix-helix domain-containing protein n=1 Tax=Galactobacter sp. TaxID=2676125 RepID=UPI0025BF43AA|nr:toxin-antitoxin system antitoxin subunit [Galactobacter sp.]
MATLTIRNVSEETKRRLQERAASNERSMEAEARSILDDATEEPGTGILRWIRNTEALRGDLDLPARSAPRNVDLQ